MNNLSVIFRCILVFNQFGRKIQFAELKTPVNLLKVNHPQTFYIVQYLLNAQSNAFEIL